MGRGVSIAIIFGAGIILGSLLDAVWLDLMNVVMKQIFSLTSDKDIVEAFVFIVKTLQLLILLTFGFWGGVLVSKILPYRTE